MKDLSNLPEEERESAMKKFNDMAEQMRKTIKFLETIESKKEGEALVVTSKDNSFRLFDFIYVPMKMTGSPIPEMFKCYKKEISDDMATYWFNSKRDEVKLISDGEPNFKYVIAMNANPNLPL